MSEIPDDIRAAAKAAFHRARLMSALDDQIDIVARAILAGREHKPAIAVELYRMAEKLGADSELLRIVGSYADTLPDETVLEQLRRWNNAPSP
jgi:hypothetical protein